MSNNILYLAYCGGNTFNGKQREKKDNDLKTNLFSYFDRVQKHDSSRERNEIEEKVGQVDISDASRHKVVDSSITYIQ